METQDHKSFVRILRIRNLREDLAIKIGIFHLLIQANFFAKVICLNVECIFFAEGFLNIESSHYVEFGDDEVEVFRKYGKRLEGSIGHAVKKGHYLEQNIVEKVLVIVPAANMKEGTEGVDSTCIADVYGLDATDYLIQFVLFLLNLLARIANF